MCLPAQQSLCVEHCVGWWQLLSFHRGQHSDLLPSALLLVHTLGNDTCATGIPVEVSLLNSVMRETSLSLAAAERQSTAFLSLRAA